MAVGSKGGEQRRETVCTIPVLHVKEEEAAPAAAVSSEAAAPVAAADASVAAAIGAVETLEISDSDDKVAREMEEKVAVEAREKPQEQKAGAVSA
jgi:hypothetical protein